MKEKTKEITISLEEYKELLDKKARYEESLKQPQIIKETIYINEPIIYPSQYPSYPQYPYWYC